MAGERKPRMNRSLLLAAPVAAAAFAMAGPARADSRYDQCMERATTNAAFTACGAQMLVRSEAELNRAWKQAAARLEPGARRALLAEQRLWIAFKDKSCAYWSSGAYGREGQAVHFYSCRAGIIGERVAYLRKVGADGQPG
jgi:uncharacterized protein YecT (DUF1311 family)